ncbi:MAG: LamG-like jellyroll fold domain-containing protein [Bacteroidota bacterium]
MKNILFTLLLLVIFITSFAQGSLNNGLVAYYPCSGNGGDSSGYNNHGTVFSGVSSSTDRNGNINKSLYFNNSTSAYINIPANASINTNTMNNFAISLWFKTSGISGIQRRLLNIQDVTQRNYDLTYDFNTNRIIYLNWNGSSASVSLYSKKVFTPNTWNQVVIRIDSLNKTQLYINGVLDTFSNNTVTKPVNPIYSIGRNLTNNWNFQGNIDDVRIYNRYLTNPEIQLLASDIVTYKNYYSKSTGDLNLLSTWGTNTDGSGSSPLSFDSSYTRYYVVNSSSPTMTNNWVINGFSSTVVLGDGLNAYNLLVPSNNNITCDSVYIRNGITLTVLGSLAINRIATENTSTVQFIGSSPQNITKGTYYNLTVNASTKSLLGNVQVLNTLTLLNHINCGSNTLTLGSSISQTGTLVRSSGNIIGTFARWFSASVTSGNAGLFPLGTSTAVYNPIQVNYTVAPNVGGMAIAQFVATNPGNVGLPLFDGLQYLDKVAQNGYWKLTTSNGLSGGTCSVTCIATGFWGISNYSDLRLVKRATGGAWTLTGNSTVNSGSNAAPELTRTSITSVAGEFGIAGDLSINALPVKFINFFANNLNNSIQLNWQTAEEINNKGFEIEKSEDGVNFTAIGFVNGVGNSSMINNYQFVDKSTISFNTIYYRLKQIDFDNQVHYSNTVKLNKVDNKLKDISVSPNPFSNNLSIILNNDGFDDLVNVQVFDVNGRESYNKEIKKSVSENQFKLDELNSLPKGIYLLRVTQNSYSQIIKLVKE